MTPFSWWHCCYRHLVAVKDKVSGKARGCGLYWNKGPAKWPSPAWASIYSESSSSSSRTLPGVKNQSSEVTVFSLFIFPLVYIPIRYLLSIRRKKNRQVFKENCHACCLGTTPIINPPTYLPTHPPLRTSYGIKSSKFFSFKFLSDDALTE